MNLSRRWNRFWIGLALGIALPTIVFLLVYLFGYVKTPFEKFLEFTFMTKVQARMLAKILSLCVIPNLIIFYIFLNKEFWYATRGVIAATFLCTLAVMAVKFL